MPTQIEKTEAHASHLLDVFIGLRERYALLHPMLFDQGTIGARGSGEQSRGFGILRRSLFLSCAQDIAKLGLDADERTPSILKIINALEDESLRRELEDRYAHWVLPPVEDEADPEIVDALRRLEEHERLERRDQFLEHHRELQRLWLELSACQAMHGFRTVRAKISAHTEVRYVADKYQLVDIATLGIKWGDLISTIARMQRIIELIGLIVRNAGFAWDSFEAQISNAASRFWGANA